MTLVSSLNVFNIDIIMCLDCEDCEDNGPVLYVTTSREMASLVRDFQHTCVDHIR